MAALIRHGSFARALQPNFNIPFAHPNVRVGLRQKSKVSKKPSQPEVINKLQYDQESIAAKGFLRPYKAYTPPRDAFEQIDQICKKVKISTASDTKLEDPVLRFQLFTTCWENFKHSIPNSMLYSIETIGDLKSYYSTPVRNITPFENLQQKKLPPNLYIQKDYVRFHPDTDTLFQGKTAFPKSSTIVTGLKYKKKYRGHKQENPWNDI